MTPLSRTCSHARALFPIGGLLLGLLGHKALSGRLRYSGLETWEQQVLGVGMLGKG